MYFKRSIEKNIKHYSLNELFYLIENSNDSQNKENARNELENRNLTRTEFKSAKRKFENYKLQIEKRKKENLTISEWFTFFFVFLKTRDFLLPNKDYVDSELERFVIYGFETKLKQAKLERKLGSVFLITILIWTFIFIDWLK